MKKLLATVLTLALAAPAFAAPPEAMLVGLVGMVRSVERGYSRAMGTLDPLTLSQPDALEMTDPFVAGGFAPRVPLGASWRLAGQDQDRSVLCLTQAVQDASAWNSAQRGFFQAGLTPADPETCLSAGRVATSPQHYPGVAAARIVLDRRDVPTRTVLPVEPILTGVDANAVTRPGLTLRPFEGQGFAELFIENPLVVLDPGPPEVLRVMGLTNVEVRPGFSYSHNCEDIAPGGACTFRIGYDGQEGDYRVGSLRLEFSNGEVAVIGLLGRTR